jgi:hypothetical protein
MTTHPSAGRYAPPADTCGSGYWEYNDDNLNGIELRGGPSYELQSENFLLESNSFNHRAVDERAAGGCTRKIDDHRRAARSNFRRFNRAALSGREGSTLLGGAD